MRVSSVSIIWVKPVTIGIPNLSANTHWGFSYIEVLMALLILSSGLLGHTLLMARMQLVQLESTQTLKEVLMMDYMTTQLAARSEVCLSVDDSVKTSCQSQRDLVASVEVGVFDETSVLLDGFVAGDSAPIDSTAALGCTGFDTVSTTYVVGLFAVGTNVQNVSTDVCNDQADVFQSLIRYRALPTGMGDGSG